MCILPSPQSVLALLQGGRDFVVFSVLEATTFLCGGFDLKVTMLWLNFSCNLDSVYYTKCEFPVE